MNWSTFLVLCWLAAPSIGCRTTGLVDLHWASDPSTAIADDYVRTSVKDCESRLNKIHQDADSAMKTRDVLTGTSAGVAAGGAGVATVLQALEAGAGTPAANASPADVQAANDATKTRSAGTIVGAGVAFVTAVTTIIIDRLLSPDELRRDYATRSAEYWQGRSRLSDDLTVSNGANADDSEKQLYHQIKTNFDNCNK